MNRLQYMVPDLYVALSKSNDCSRIAAATYLCDMVVDLHVRDDVDVKSFLEAFRSDTLSPKQLQEYKVRAAVLHRRAVDMEQLYRAFGTVTRNNCEESLHHFLVGSALEQIAINDSFHNVANAIYEITALFDDGDLQKHCSRVYEILGLSD